MEKENHGREATTSPSKKGDLRLRGVTELHLAAGNNDIVKVEELLRAKPKFFTDVESGWSPLHRACHSGALGIAARLLTHGADKDQYDREGLAPFDLLRGKLLGASDSASLQQGGVWSWGASSNHQLGYACHSRSAVQQTPKQVLLDRTGHLSAVRVATARHHSMALTAGGVCYVWGVVNGIFEQLSSASAVVLPQCLPIGNITHIACCDTYSAVVNSNGDIYTWGQNSNGQLGYSGPAKQLTPKQIASLADQHVTRVACCSTHTILCTRRGHVYTFGDNSSGQLGYFTGTTTSTVSTLQSPLGASPPQHRTPISVPQQPRGGHCEPKRVEALLSKTAVVDVACVPGHSLVLTDSGEVYCFGGGSYHLQAIHHMCRRVRDLCGLKYHRVATMRFVSIAATPEFGAGVIESGDVYVWQWGKEPFCLYGLSSHHIVRVTASCGGARGKVFAISDRGFVFECLFGKKASRMCGLRGAVDVAAYDESHTLAVIGVIVPPLPSASSTCVASLKTMTEIAICRYVTFDNVVDMLPAALSLDAAIFEEFVVKFIVQNIDVLAQHGDLMKADLVVLDELTNVLTGKERDEAAVRMISLNKVRKLRKTLKQIHRLLCQQTSGRELTSAEQMKVSRRPVIVAELTILGVTAQDDFSTSPETPPRSAETTPTSVTRRRRKSLTAVSPSSMPTPGIPNETALPIVPVIGPVAQSGVVELIEPIVNTQPQQQTRPQRKQRSPPSITHSEKAKGASPSGVWTSSSPAQTTSSTAPDVTAPTKLRELIDEDDRRQAQRRADIKQAMTVTSQQVESVTPSVKKTTPTKPLGWGSAKATGPSAPGLRDIMSQQKQPALPPQQRQHSKSTPMRISPQHQQQHQQQVVATSASPDGPRSVNLSDMMRNGTSRKKKTPAKPVSTPASWNASRIIPPQQSMSLSDIQAQQQADHEKFSYEPDSRWRVERPAAKSLLKIQLEEQKREEQAKLDADDEELQAAMKLSMEQYSLESQRWS
eukprot:TRINITY_DN8795_c0_g2_i1.p1 TRINITY_DN8795_c0_g2~~TRINITY_DN8795_c0_g2_i1.p1  ORF type:complete len:996 (-),score=201.45 TRINITY_DN8795_c0_g2_i1:151-3138(-)